MRTSGKLIGTGALVLAAMGAAASPAHATRAGVCKVLPILCRYQPPRSAPEIDPSLLRGMLTVLGGGVLMLAERRRRGRS